MKFAGKTSKTLLLTAVVYGVLGWAIYAHVLRGEFISDDYPYIVDNFAVRNLGALGTLWHSFTTRFLVMLTFALNYRLHQLDTTGYHLVNIFLHIANALLVWGFVTATFRMPAMKEHPLQPRVSSIAFYAGLVFLCHPIQTQAVSYITQRATSMACFFYLLTLILYINGRTRNNFIFFPAAWAAMLLGALSKEVTVTLPITLVVYEFFFSDDFVKKWKTRLRDILPFVAVSAVLVFIFMQDRPGSVLELKGQLSGRRFSWVYFLTEINVLRTYLRLMILPVNQNHHYAYPLSRSFLEPGTLFSASLLIGLFLSAVGLFRKHRFISFGIIWFFITTSVEFTVVCFVNRGVLYEHWLYLPMVGFSVAFVLALHLLLPGRRAFRAAALLVIAALCVLTYVRNFVWQTEIGFWEDVVRKSPRSSLVYLGSGTAYQRKGLLPLAFDQYKKGLALFAGEKKKLRDVDLVYLSRIYNNLGLIYQSIGRDRDAIRSFQRSYQFSPHNASAYHNLAKICLDRGKYRQAIVFLKAERDIETDDPDIYYGLGLAFLGLKENKKAVVFFEKARELELKYGDEVHAGNLARLGERLSNLLTNDQASQ